MGGRSGPAPQQQSSAPPPPPTPIPDPKAKDTPAVQPGTSYAEQQAAKDEDQNKAGLGATSAAQTDPRRRTQRDPASLANTASNSLGSSAVVTG